MIRKLMATLLMAGALLATGCSTIGKTSGMVPGGSTASIPQSLLGSVPCLTRAAEAQFGVTPEVVEDTTHWIVRLTLKLPPAAGEGSRVRYELRSPDGKSTRVRYEIDGPKDRRDPLELEAFDPIERCAGVRVSGK